MTTADSGPGFRSGFVSFVGRPNAGKSTLTNAMVGQKVVITSDKPQTTRTVVRGIVNRPDAQLILVDTPGLHRPRTLLGGAAQRPGQDDVGRGRRGRCVLSRQREDRAGRPVHRLRAGEGTTHRQGRRRHQDRSRLARADRPAPAGHRRPGPVDGHHVGRGGAGVGRLGQPGRPARRPVGRDAARRPAALPRRRPDRRARGDPGSRADPRSRSRRRSRRAASLHRRRGRGDGAARGTARKTDRCSTSTPTSTSSARRRRASSSATRAPGCARSAPTPANRSRPCSAPPSTSTSTSRSPRTGSATPSSSASSASEASGRARTASDVRACDAAGASQARTCAAQAASHVGPHRRTVPVQPRLLSRHADLDRRSCSGRPNTLPPAEADGVVPSQSGVQVAARGRHRGMPSVSWNSRPSSSTYWLNASYKTSR